MKDAESPHLGVPPPLRGLQAFLIWLESSALALAPWLILFVKFRRAQPGVLKKPVTARRPVIAQTLPASWKGMRSLTLGLCFATVATGLGWLDIGLSSLPANTLTPYISGTAGPFAVLILGAWAWSPLDPSDSATPARLARNSHLASCPRFGGLGSFFLVSFLEPIHRPCPLTEQHPPARPAPLISCPERLLRPRPSGLMNGLLPVESPRFVASTALWKPTATECKFRG